MRSLRPVTFIVWLVLAFAWGQQATLQHSLGHLAGNRSQHPGDGTPAPVKCADCALYAGLADTIGSTPAAFGLPLASLPLSPLPAGHEADLAPRRQFDSRAPPAAG